MLTVRHIKTKTVQTTAGDRVVPELDDQGREIVLWSVDVPADIEAEGGAAIDAHVAAELAKPAPSAAAADVTSEDATHG